MKYLPYKLIALVSLIVSFLIGGLIQAGAEYIEDQTVMDMIGYMPIQALSNYPIKRSGLEIN